MGKRYSQLLVGIEVSGHDWKLAFGDGEKEWETRVDARDPVQFFRACTKARSRFRFPRTSGATCAFESAKDREWICDMLKSHSLNGVVIDGTTIPSGYPDEINEQLYLTAMTILRLLVRRYFHGDTKAFTGVDPSVEDPMMLDRIKREAKRLRRECGVHRNRIHSLLDPFNVKKVDDPATCAFESLRTNKNMRLPRDLIMTLKREQERMRLTMIHLEKVMKELEKYEETPP